ncbi:REP-associated tyrosine transposase [Motilimonas sp. KMU-193]|uniref:REP-associated tyrosine transposase n=1 Tax=Motilimonas sp. KMU-193 TaxID=3388668 RepID=UPI00396B303E
MTAHGANLRRGRFSSPNQIYSLTAVTHLRQPFFNDLHAARILINILKQSDLDNQSKTLAFVVMPDHFHWLVQLTYAVSLSQLVKTVKQKTAYQLHLQNRADGKIWQPSYYDHALRAEEDIVSVCRYIIANPLRANITNSVKNYPHWDCIYLT